MMFHEPRFVVFLTLVYLAFWALVRHKAARNLLLLAASCFFYMSWNPTLILLIVWATGIDYVAANRIYASDSPRVRKAWLLVSLVTNLGTLAFFKYAGWMLDSARASFAWLGVDVPVPVLEVVLPVGISFYTFHTLSYTIDVYRRQLVPRASILDFGLFVLFFPTLVAGPILRASHFLPQLDEEPRLWQRQGTDALVRIAIGMVKKLAFADVLAVYLVDQPFANPEPFSSLECLVAVYAYAFQIYLDFSAYSDIALGAATLFGFRLAENFDAPYQSATLTEFWRRWHISLSTWLRDYLYVPLGGNRKGKLRTYVNLLATMLLGGLWHGAAWTFVAWGALHGVGLAIERLLGITGGSSATLSPWRRAAGAVVTFHVVCLAWVFFRAPSFDAAFALLARIGELVPGAANLAAGPLIALAVAALSHLAPLRWNGSLADAFGKLPVPARAALLVLLAVGVKQVAQLESVPFIYFQF